MNGRDLLLNLSYIGDDLVEEAEFECLSKRTENLPNPVLTAGNSKTVRKGLLIAALISLILLLVGCAIYVYRLEQLVIQGNTAPTTATAEEPALIVAPNVLSMQGYEGSPSYLAVREWNEYVAAYISENPECRFDETYRRPDDYYTYSCYTPEMVDKVDEFCEKYGLHTIGKYVFLKNISEMEEHGLTDILAPGAQLRCLNGLTFRDGTFEASGELELTGEYEKTVQFQMHSPMKDAFYSVTLGLQNLSDYMQWNYRTKDGYSALMAMNDRTGYIFVESEDRFISVIVEEVPSPDMVFEGIPQEKRFLEAVCDCFSFSKP